MGDKHEERARTKKAIEAANRDTTKLRKWLQTRIDLLEANPNADSNLWTAGFDRGYRCALRDVLRRIATAIEKEPDSHD